MSSPSLSDNSDFPSSDPDFPSSDPDFPKSDSDPWENLCDPLEKMSTHFSDDYEPESPKIHLFQPTELQKAIITDDVENVHLFLNGTKFKKYTIL